MTTVLEITMCPIHRLRPYAKNPRRNDAEVERMAAAIQEFGFKIPMLALRDGQLIDGHLRLKAALQMGLDSVPVIFCDDWTKAQVKAFRLLVNRSATWADWDTELLALELADIHELGFELAFTGFDAPEIDNLLFRPPSAQELDVLPPLPEHPVTLLGDVWLCGENRVLCGDATSAEDVDRMLESRRPGVMITDPPYGVAYDPLWREQAGLGQARQVGRVTNDDRVDWSAAYRLFPGDVAYVWHAGVHAAEVGRSLQEADFDLRSQIIWAKQHFVLSRGHYHWQH